MKNRSNTTMRHNEMTTNEKNRLEAKRPSRRKAKQELIKRNIILSILCFALTMTFLLSLNSMSVNAKTNRSNCYKYFTVVEVKIGDTLTSIASKYYDENYYNNLNEFMKEIKYSNQIANCNNLKEGQTLVIPYYSPEYHF